MPRPLNRAKLTRLATHDMSPPMGVGALAWRYSIFIPLEELGRNGKTRFLASDEDIETLSEILCKHFSGVSILPALMGWGLRDTDQPDSLELNKNVPFVVYA